MDLPAHATGQVRSGDVSIFYRRFGQPGAVPVLIVHGLSYFSYDWIIPAARIAADREVVAIDMRGLRTVRPQQHARLQARDAEPRCCRGAR